MPAVGCCCICAAADDEAGVTPPDRRRDEKPETGAPLLPPAAAEEAERGAPGVPGTEREGMAGKEAIESAMAGAEVAGEARCDCAGLSGVPVPLAEAVGIRERSREDGAVTDSPAAAAATAAVFGAMMEETAAEAEPNWGHSEVLRPLSNGRCWACCGNRWREDVWLNGARSRAAEEGESVLD